MNSWSVSEGSAGIVGLVTHEGNVVRQTSHATDAILEATYAIAAARDSFPHVLANHLGTDNEAGPHLATGEILPGIEGDQTTEETSPGIEEGQAPVKGRVERMLYAATIPQPLHSMVTYPGFLSSSEPRMDRPSAIPPLPIQELRDP